MQVTVHFVGICTHIRDAFRPLPRPGMEPLNPISRVVLVDASHGLRVPLSDGVREIPPHSALLYIPRKFIAGELGPMDGLTTIRNRRDARWKLWKRREPIWTMHGVALQLEHSNDPLTFTGSYDCMPSLTKAARQPLSPDDRVAEHGGAACVFRVLAGHLDAYASREPSGAVVGKLTIHTTVPPELTVTRIWHQQTSTIRLKSSSDGHEPEIFVANVGRDPDRDDSNDSDDDFLLHYGVTTWTPDAVIHPDTTCDIRDASQKEQTSLEHALTAMNVSGLAHGCSNSTYP